MGADDGRGPVGRVRRLEAGEVRRAGELLARGMHDDPLFVHLLRDAAHRARRLPGLLASLVRFGVRYGVAETTAGGMDGVAVWLPPGTEMTPGRMLRVGTVPAALRLGPRGLRRFAALLRVSEAAHTWVVSAPHWCLPELAVEPTRQRQGVGGRLMTAALARADAGGASCYLETTNPATLPFYRRHGFVEVVEGALPGGPAFWGMLRPPAR